MRALATVLAATIVLGLIGLAPSSARQHNGRQSAAQPIRRTAPLVVDVGRAQASRAAPGFFSRYTWNVVRESVLHPFSTSFFDAQGNVSHRVPARAPVRVRR